MAIVTDAPPIFIQQCTRRGTTSLKFSYSSSNCSDVKYVKSETMINYSNNKFN